MFYGRKFKPSSASGKSKHHETLNVNCVSLSVGIQNSDGHQADHET